MKKADRNVLTDTSYLNQKAFLTSNMGEDHAHVVEGVLYYRVRFHFCMTRALHVLLCAFDYIS
jgi:hypothetical protein